MKLSEAWNNYEADKRLEGYSPYTLKAYGIQSGLLLRFLSDVNINEITTEHLKSHLSKDAARLKASSLGHRIRFLKSLFRWALEEGHIGKNPASKIKEPKQGTRIPKFLSEEEIEMLREGCAAPLDHAVLEILFATGSRIGEIHRLNKSDVNFHNNSIVVHGKGNKEREVYFKAKCRYWLKKYIDSRTDNDDALFVTERSPHRRSAIPQLRYIIKRVARRSEVKINVYPHKFRHSLAQKLADNDCPLEVIQSILGHQRSDTTKIYTFLSGERRKQLYNKYS